MKQLDIDYNFQYINGRLESNGKPVISTYNNKSYHNKSLLGKLRELIQSYCGADEIYTDIDGCVEAIKHLLEANNVDSKLLK